MIQAGMLSVKCRDKVGGWIRRAGLDSEPGFFLQCTCLSL